MILIKGQMREWNLQGKDCFALFAFILIQLGAISHWNICNGQWNTYMKMAKLQAVVQNRLFVSILTDMKTNSETGVGRELSPLGEGWNGSRENLHCCHMLPDVCVFFLLDLYTLPCFCMEYMYTVLFVYFLFVYLYCSVIVSFIHLLWLMCSSFYTKCHQRSTGWDHNPLRKRRLPNKSASPLWFRSREG